MTVNTEQYRSDGSRHVNLSSFDPNDIGVFDPVDGKETAKNILKKQKKELADLQNLLYADSSRSLLVVLQALDAGGKDSTIRKVFSGVNPQGVRVISFKAPSREERAHDFLWRVHKAAPRRGMIHVFNRSHYEDVLAVRVRDLAPEAVWSKRFDHINAFETLLHDAGTAVVKLYLHISKEEQKERFQSRLDEPKKHWKFNPGDLEDRALWPKYQEAFEDVFVKCSQPHAPWYIIPANRKWYRNVVVAQILLETLKHMNLSYPGITYNPGDITIPD